MAEYVKAIGSLLTGVVAVIVAYKFDDGHGLACDGLLGHMYSKDGEEASKSFSKILHEHEGHMGERWWGWLVARWDS